MKRRKIRRAIQAARQPPVRRVIDAEELQVSDSTVAALGVGRSMVAALDRLQTVADAGNPYPTLLIPDPRRSSEPGPRLTFDVASRLAARGALAIGLPSTLSDAEFRRWSNLADRAGAALTLLGTAGWSRIDFGDRSLILTHADAPAELHAAATVVALSAPSGTGCLGLWSHVVHPNTAIRARFVPNAVVELSAIVNARYLLTGKVGSAWIAAWAESPFTAELIARGIECARERTTGGEMPGPWEDAGVQHLSGIRGAGARATDLVLRVRLEDNADEQLARLLGEMLGWRLELEFDDDTGGVGD